MARLCKSFWQHSHFGPCVCLSLQLTWRKKKKCFKWKNKMRSRLHQLQSHWAHKLCNGITSRGGDREKSIKHQLFSHRIFFYTETWFYLKHEKGPNGILQVFDLLLILLTFSIALESFISNQPTHSWMICVTTKSLQPHWIFRPKLFRPIFHAHAWRHSTWRWKLISIGKTSYQPREWANEQPIE